VSIDALEREITQLVAELAPHLLIEPGFGPLTVAKLLGEVAGIQRFATDAKLARAVGVAPIPISSGKTRRQRLDRGGNRQLNATLHRIAVTRARCHPETMRASPANAPKARPPEKPSVASSATSPARSGTCSKRPLPTGRGSIS
jgi:transposase